MHPTQLAPTGRRVGSLDDCLARGLWIDFYDPDGGRSGLPTYPYHWAPDGLLAIRQLRDEESDFVPAARTSPRSSLWNRKGRRCIASLPHRSCQA